MGNELKRALAVATAASLALALTACGSGGSTNRGGDETVTIGATLPMTGGGAAYGNSMSKGLQAAVNVLNATKAVPGVTFQLKMTDDQAQPGLATSQATQLATVNHAVAIVSAFTTPPIAQLKTAARYQIAILNGGGNDPSLLNHDYLYNDILSSTQEEKAALQYAKDKLNVSSLGMLIEGDYTSAGIADMGKVGSEMFPGKSTAVTVDVSTNDPTPYIQHALANHPSALYVGLPGALLDQTLKQLGSMGVKIPIITASQAFALNDLTKLPITPQLLVSRQSYTPTPAYSAAMKKYYPSFTTDIYTGTYYSLAFIIAKAVAIAKQHGGISSEAVNKALQAIPPVEGCCGKTAFTSQHGTTSSVQLVQFDAHGRQKVVASVPAPTL